MSAAKGDESKQGSAVADAPPVDTDATNTSKIPSQTHDIQARDEGREQWSNQVEFVLSTLGLAVGLGNIWRFPLRAYENGGSAFLIPYITCAVMFGLPAMYLEFLLGQYHRTTPPILFRRFAPILQGVGWMNVAVSSSVAVYYIILIGWIGIYIFTVILGNVDTIIRCNNPWNDANYCMDMSEQVKCMGNATNNLTLFFNGTCRTKDVAKALNLVVASEQFFTDYVIQPSSGFLDFNTMNWKALIAAAICWLCTFLILCKGVAYMGKTAYVTVVMPYVIVLILFIRGVTLDGAADGLSFYLGRPDFTVVFGWKAWVEALTQLCFSLSIGYGGMITMASFSRPRNNCFRDALIVVIGDTTMSLIGGGAVFSTLGFLAKQKGQTIPEVTKGGTGLAFVVYPEALNKMPLPWLWALLFFVMLFFLGMSSEVALVEVGCAALCDQVPSLRNKKGLVVGIWCLILFSLGLVMCTDAGVYWFTMFDEYAAGISACMSVTTELVIVSFIYGRKNQMVDMVDMLGPAKSTFSSWFGMQSPYFPWNWMLVSPLFGIALIVMSVISRQYPFDGNAAAYPVVFDIMGWFICLLPILLVPLFGVVAYYQFKRDGWDTRGLFMKQRQLRSYPRLYEAMSETERWKQLILPDREPWDVEPKGFAFPGVDRQQQEVSPKALEDGAKPAAEPEKKDEKEKKSEPDKKEEKEKKSDTDKKKDEKERKSEAEKKEEEKEPEKEEKE